MQNGTFTSGYTNIGGIPIGQPISSPFEPRKHLEANSYSRYMGQENTWMGILNILDKYNKVKMPFISMTELSKNVLEVDGEGSKFTFGVPFIKGCPFILENLCEGQSRLGAGNTPWFIVLSENVYTYGDVITSDFRNGRQIRIQTIRERGEEARIVPHGNGWRFMVALDSIHGESDTYPAELLAQGTPYMKLFQNNGGEFENIMSSYSGLGDEGEGRQGVQLYEYTVGNSKQAIHTWVTADATYKSYKLHNASHPALNHLNGASTDILNYWTPGSNGKPMGLFWIPSFIQKMAAELAAMKERFLLWSQGSRIVSNGREQITQGLGYYQQIKQRGNYDTYSDFRQLFNMVMNFAEKLFTVHNQVPVDERIVRLRAGRLAYQELRKQFGQYFKTDNPFTVMADHPALIKAGLITNDSKGGLLYNPVVFNGIKFNDMGTLLVEHDPTLDKLDDYLESPQHAGHGSLTSGMVFIDDITDGNFSNAIPKELKQEGKNYKNVTMIKTRGYVDKREFLVGSDCSTQLLNMLGVYGNGDLVSTWNKGLEIRLSTDGEIWVQDPSRCWIIEYDPYGDIARNSPANAYNRVI